MALSTGLKSPPQYKPVAQGTGTAAFPAEQLKWQKAASQEMHQQVLSLGDAGKKGEEKKLTKVSELQNRANYTAQYFKC